MQARGGLSNPDELESRGPGRISAAKGRVHVKSPYAKPAVSAPRKSILRRERSSHDDGLLYENSPKPVTQPQPTEDLAPPPTVDAEAKPYNPVVAMINRLLAKMRPSMRRKSRSTRDPRLIGGKRPCEVAAVEPTPPLAPPSDTVSVASTTLHPSQAIHDSVSVLEQDEGMSPADERWLSAGAPATQGTVQVAASQPDSNEVQAHWEQHATAQASSWASPWEIPHSAWNTTSPSSIVGSTSSSGSAYSMQGYRDAPIAQWRSSIEEDETMEEDDSDAMDVDDW